MVALTLVLGLRVTSSMVQNWLSPLTSAQICSTVPFSVAMPGSSSLPARLDLILTRPSLVGSTTHSWLEACAPSHWWTRVPSLTPPISRSIILPVKRFWMR